jgi:CD109 antigen
MAIMEVTLPSGYTLDNDALPSLRVSNNIKRIETKDGDSVVMLYFDKVNSHDNIYGNAIVIYLFFHRNRKYFSFKLLNF